MIDWRNEPGTREDVRPLGEQQFGDERGILNRGFVQWRTVVGVLSVHIGSLLNEIIHDRLTLKCDRGEQCGILLQLGPRVHVGTGLHQDFYHAKMPRKGGLKGRRFAGIIEGVGIRAVPQ